MSKSKKIKFNKEFWKKIGWVGFFFFLIKGLLWIVGFYFLADKIAN